MCKILRILSTEQESVKKLRFNVDRLNMKNSPYIQCLQERFKYTVNLMRDFEQKINRVLLKNYQK